MNHITLIGLILLSAAATAQPSAMTKEQKANEYIRAIQESHVGVELDKKLKVIDPDLQDRTWVLPVIFHHLLSTSETPASWDALCRLDQWGDGAWHLEMDAAAFDAFAQSPKVFVDRYLSGDDCALLLLMYAYRWPLEAPDVGGIDCTPEGMHESERFDRAIKASHEVIISARAPATVMGRNRDQSLLQILATVEEAWWAQYQRFRKTCETDHR